MCTVYIYINMNTHIYIYLHNIFSYIHTYILLYICPLNTDAALLWNTSGPQLVRLGDLSPPPCSMLGAASDRFDGKSLGGRAGLSCQQQQQSCTRLLPLSQQQLSESWRLRLLSLWMTQLIRSDPTVRLEAVLTWALILFLHLVKGFGFRSLLLRVGTALSCAARASVSEARFWPADRVTSWDIFGLIAEFENSLWSFVQSQ